MRLGKHIAVIGAGVVGLAIALKLRREGYRVTIFEPEEPGSQVSAGSAGMIMTAQAVPFTQRGLWRKVPSMLNDREGPLFVHWGHLPRLTPWLRRFLRNSRRKRYEAIAETLAPLTGRSFDSWLELIGPHEGSKLLRQDGLLYVFKTSKAFRAARRDAEFRERYGVASQIIPPEELRQMEPALGANLAGGVLYPDSGHCTDLKKLASSLSIAFRTAGGELCRATVRELKSGGNGIVRVVCDDAEHKVEEAVVSAGLWSGPLVKPYGVKQMLAAERGYHLMLKEPHISLRRPLIAGEDRFAITPFSEGIRLAGTSEFASAKTPPDWSRADMLLDQAKTILPEINGEETATRWMGPRPSTPDSLPVIGRTPKNPNIICAYGHGHLGLTLGAVTADIVADLVARRDTAGMNPEGLKPDRF
jgi:D-amino-acid dehydrogenase